MGKAVSLTWIEQDGTLEMTELLPVVMPVICDEAAQTKLFV